MSVLPTLRADLYRLRHTRGAWLGILLPALVAVLQLSSAAASARRQAVLGSMAGSGAGSDAVAAPANGFGPLADAVHTGGVLLALFALLFGALALVREREVGSLSILCVSRPRTGILAAKLASLFVVVTAAFALMLAVAIAAAALLFDLGPIVEEGYEMATRAELWKNFALATSAALPAFLAAGCFGLFLSAVTRGTGVAVAATLVPFALLDFLRGLFGESAQWIFVTYVPFLGKQSTLARLENVARAYSDAGWQPGELLHATLVPLASVAALTLLAAIALEVREPEASSS
jgi:hypothetical protein